MCRYLFVRGRRPCRHDRRAWRTSTRRNSKDRLLGSRNSRGTAHHTRSRMGTNNGTNVNRHRTRALRRSFKHYNVHACVGTRVTRSTRRTRGSGQLTRRDRTLPRNKETSLFLFLTSKDATRPRGNGRHGSRVSQRRRPPTRTREQGNLHDSPRNSM